MTENSMEVFVSEYSTCLLRLKEHREQRYALEKELKELERKIRNLQAERNQLQKRFANFIQSLDKEE